MFVECVEDMRMIWAEVHVERKKKRSQLSDLNNQTWCLKALRFSFSLQNFFIFFLFFTFKYFLRQSTHRHQQVCFWPAGVCECFVRVFSQRDAFQIQSIFLFLISLFFFINCLSLPACWWQETNVCKKASRGIISYLIRWDRGMACAQTWPGQGERERERERTGMEWLVKYKYKQHKINGQ